MDFEARRYRGLQGVRPAVFGPDGMELEPCSWLCLHSPVLQWSHAGPASAQAALAILRDHIGRVGAMTDAEADRVALHLHQQFKSKVVSRLPLEWVMLSRAIDEFRDMFVAERVGQDVDWGLWRSSICERGLLVALTGRPILRG